MSHRSRWLLLFAPFTLTIGLLAQQDSVTFVRSEILIPMRDGVRLNTVIFIPSSDQGLFPFLLLRTPYGVSGQPAPDRMSYLRNLAKDGYIFVHQDIRGRYKSEGRFEMQRMARNRKDPRSIDESTDTYNTIDWLLKNIPNNNGRAGMLGISYGGWTTVMGTIEAHPAMKAASEQATPADMFLGDDFHHNGAFRLSYGFEYAFMEEASKTDTLFPFGTYDIYDWFLRLGPLSNVNALHFKNAIPSWNDFVRHPNYDEFWQRQALASRLDAPTVPTLHVAGWWDQEDFYGPLTAYRILEKKDAGNKNFIVVGPWNHGGWSRGDGNQLGRVEFDTATGRTFREIIQRSWFAYYLKDVGDGKFPEAMTFQTGANRWRSYSAWPPQNETVTRKLYLRANGQLSFEPPSDADAADTFVSDPAKPVPYRPRPIEQTYGRGSRWYTWLVEDQRFVDGRPDVLTWKTDPLTEDLTMTGDIAATLFASTTGSDTDWIVKLIDVYPAELSTNPTMGGFQLMVANEVFRGRFRNGFEKPEPVKPGEVNRYTVDMRQMNHVFLKGHRVMVQVQSTWFPIIDRNPQTYVPNIFEAKESNFKAQTHSIQRTVRNPSHLLLPVAIR